MASNSRPSSFAAAAARSRARFHIETSPVFAVAAAGHATDPDYEMKLLAIIASRNLTRFDNLEMQP